MELLRRTSRPILPPVKAGQNGFSPATVLEETLQGNCLEALAESGVLKNCDCAIMKLPPQATLTRQSKKLKLYMRRP
jgi:hypothetical protein